jgi:beta-galactosidase
MKSKKWIEVSILVSLFAFGGLTGSRVSGDIQEGLVAYFQFEEGDGDELDDSSGLGNNASISGDVEWVEGKYDKGMQFDGESSYAEIPPGTVGPFEAVTMTAWVKLAKMPSTNSYNITGMTTGPGSGLYVELYSVALAAWQCQPNNTNASIPYPTMFDEWHHLTGVYNGADIILYIDGEEKAKGAGATLPDVTSLPFRISGDHSELANWAGSIDGVVDEVRLYGRALEPDEVKDAMESAEGKAVTLAGKLSTTWGEAKRAL